MKITQLAYIGIESPDFRRWELLGPSVFGFELAEPGSDGAIRLRVDERHHRIAAHPGARDRLAYLGWEVADETDFEAGIVELTNANIAVRRADTAKCAARAVTRLASFEDPFGFTHEFSFGPTQSSPFTPGRSISGFVTGDGGLGHAVLMVGDLESATAFYTCHLGMRLSDTIHDVTEARFFHCNPRHHSLAIAAPPLAPKGLQHMMVEVRTIDEVGTAYELCRRHGIPIRSELGRHPNDKMFSFYCLVPGGFELEYGYGGRRIEDESQWQPTSYTGFSEWGHGPRGGARALRIALGLLNRLRGKKPASKSLEITT